MIEPNVLAFQNIPILEAIEDKTDGQWGFAELAAHMGRDKSNTRRTCLALTAEGILQDPPLAGLTDEGRAQLAAYKRAKHGGERRRAKGRWPLDKFRRNPTNRRIDPDAVLGLADAIAGVGDILVPLVASMPDDDGVRTIWAGERRWLAATRLVQTGELPEALLEGLPFNEREADKGEAALITLVENGSRTDLTPWEDAQQLRIAADATGLNATELARRIGRARDGDRGGLRDVQAKIKVAREAEPEAIAAYEADPSAPGAWEALRDSVSKSKPKPEPEIITTKAQRLALAELLHKAGHADVDVAILPAAFSAEGERLQQYRLIVLRRNDKGDLARVTPTGLEYLQAEGLSGSIENARARLGFPEGYGVARYRTEWLNTPVKAQVADQPDPDVAALAGIEPITDTPSEPLLASDFGVPEDWSCFADGKYGNEAFAIAAEWLEPGSLETLSLPHRKGQEDFGFPRAQIQLGRIRDSDGWIEADGYSVSGLGNHVTLHGVTNANTVAYASRDEALAAGIESLREGLTRNLRTGVPADIQKWLAGLNGETAPDDPLVVNGIRYPNASRAGEARRAAGLEKIRANHGSGARRALETPAPAIDTTDVWDRDEAAIAADEALLKRAKAFGRGTALTEDVSRAGIALLKDLDLSPGWLARPGGLVAGYTADAANLWEFATIDVESDWPPQRAEAVAELVAWALARAFPNTLATAETACRECGCTESRACMTPDGPCAWAEPDLCTACADHPTEETA